MERWGCGICAACPGRSSGNAGCRVGGSIGLSEEPAPRLTNTNPAQWEVNAQLPMVEAFDYRFLSFELGMIKPDPRLFAHVASLLDTPPGRILFLDDLATNIDAAAKAGFVAVQVAGVVEASNAIRHAGLPIP
jgi:beta-phosphoglucomutase-like phosphatase (HAD superfamily)